MYIKEIVFYLTEKHKMLKKVGAFLSQLILYEM